MSTYFSQLIQQTGIALAGVERSSGVDFPNQVANELAWTSTPVEDETEIKIPENNEEKFQSEHKQTNTVMQVVNNNKIPISPSFSNPDAPPPISQTEVPLLILEEQQSTLFKKPVELSSPSLSPTLEENTVLSVSHSRKLPKENSENILESSTNPIAKIQRPHKTSSPHHSVQSPKLETISPDSNQLPAPLQAVREWVAAVPEQRPLPVISEKLSTRESLPLASQTLLTKTSPLPHETQEFVLSIGTISLTVEAAQPEIRSSSSTPKTAQPQAKSVNPTSRLNRHYIRHK